MPSSSLLPYIPLGSLLVDGIRGHKIEAPVSSEWIDFSHPSRVSDNPESRYLDDKAQQQMMRNLPPKLHKSLFEAQWIHLQAYFHPSNQTCLLRVYALPDDAAQISIPRHDAKLRKRRAMMFTILDYSPGAWKGDFNSSPQSGPKPAEERHTPATDKGMNLKESSLLHMFNEIPAPSPEPSKIKDLECRDVAEDLLSCQVYGIKSTLYPYQGRSAALMVQREASPERVVDPRLREMQDQNGSVFFYDSLAGVVLRDARYYDGISGGILAEEMGAGKTLICLALIAATKGRPAKAPDIYRDPTPQKRERIASLADMAAASATQNSVSWSHYFEFRRVELGEEHDSCLEILKRQPGFYTITAPSRVAQRRASSRHGLPTPKPARNNITTRIYLSSASIVVVPANLVQQWAEEIRKHTAGLDVLILDRKEPIPNPVGLLHYNIILFSQPRFEALETEGHHCPALGALVTALSRVHFKRIIVDEGHRLGNSRISHQSRLLTVANSIPCSARWIVTGTPSDGLYGVDDLDSTDAAQDSQSKARAKTRHQSSNDQEAADLIKLGSIASMYLKVPPWANNSHDPLDLPAEWRRYVMQPKHSKTAHGDEKILRKALQTLIIRHPVSELKNLLPCVDEKIVLLEGSYQDKLALNLFSAMIIANSVQSQRTDKDYFFHPNQRTSLNELVNNLKQASFFGACFFSRQDIGRAVAVAETFLETQKVAVSKEDEKLLRSAIKFMKEAALDNGVREASNMYQELPLVVKNFPGPHAKDWALDDRDDGDTVLLSAPLVGKLQKVTQPCLDSPFSLMVLLGNKIAEAGKVAKDEYVVKTDNNKHQKGAASSSTNRPKAGEDKPNHRQQLTMTGQNDNTGLLKSKYRNADQVEDIPPTNPETGIPKPLQNTKIVSTASAKLSYLIDSISRYQEEDQILVFYENDNVAFYLAGALEILQIKHLIYARGLSVARRVQYITTFNTLPTFRVLLMDTALAAFGLDMRAASRIYFVSPVLNPQLEAQAIGRARRISQHKPVTVETLVLKGSLEEVVVERKGMMSRAEHRRCKSILDLGPVREWVGNSKILPLDDLGIARHSTKKDENNAENGSGGGVGHGEGEEAETRKAVGMMIEAQMAPLETPQYVFCRDFGRQEHPDQDLVKQDDMLPTASDNKRQDEDGAMLRAPRQRWSFPANGNPMTSRGKRLRSPSPPANDPAKRSKVRFADGN